MKKQILKRMISCIMSLIIVISMGSTVIASENVNWDDVKDYYPFSSWAVDTGLKYDLIFLENNSRETTRLEVATIIYNIIGKEKNETNDVTFKDLDEVDEKGKNIIETIASNNIIKGYEDNTFRPFNKVTRAEFVAILDRSNVLKNIKGNKNIEFSDIENHWAKDSISNVTKLGIVTGKGEGKFCPQDTITPQEILIILDRLVNLNVISDKELINIMTTTFKCKKYSEKENYITEYIYGNFSTIQNDIIYTWPLTEHYDPSNWQALSTYEELQYAIFFTLTTETYIPKDGKNNKLYNDIVKSTYISSGLEANNEINGNKTFTLRDLISSIRYATEYYRRNEYLYIHPLTDSKENIKYTNVNEFSKEDIISLNALVLQERNNYYYIINEEIYLPLDAPVTNCILNYFILNLRNSFYWKQDHLGDNDTEFETNPNNFPSNYYEYPYIIKGIPNEVYEKKVDYHGMSGGNGNARETYIKRFGRETGEITWAVTKYYNTIVNIDYTNDDWEAFKTNIYDNSTYVSLEEIDEYIEYAKSNKIILKGSAKAIPGTIVIYEPFAYIRVMMEFEIVSANENKNLLFLDNKNIKAKEIMYENNKYSFVVDVPIHGSLHQLENGKYDFLHYKASEAVVYECLYPENYEYVMR